MVFRRRFFPRRRRRFTKKKTPWRKSTVPYQHVPRAVGSFRGEHLVRRMRFTLNEGDAHTLTSTTGALSADYVYRANDLYDPYQGAGGQQPRGFDQIGALFRNFVVLGSKIKIFFGYEQASATSYDMQIALVLRDSTSAITSAQDLLESSRLRTMLMTQAKTNNTLTHCYSYRVTGTHDPYANHNLHGTSASSPTEGWNYHIVAFQPSGGTEALAFTGYIDYYAVFFHAAQPTAS